MVFNRSTTRARVSVDNSRRVNSRLGMRVPNVHLGFL